MFRDSWFGVKCECFWIHGFELSANVLGFMVLS